MLGCAAQLLANADVCTNVAQAFALRKMIALQKSGAQRRVRGIAGGDTLRRRVAKTLAKQFGADFAEACAPRQFGVATKAGSDCIIHLLRAESDGDEHRVIISLDGVGAYDHARRATMLRRLHQLPVLRRSASLNLLPSERVFSFLDDLYLVTTKARAGVAFQELAGQVERHAGVKTNLGKLRAWCRGGGAAPPDLATFGAEVWTADKPKEENGLIILGTPLGTREFVEAHAAERMRKELFLLAQVCKMQDLQCAWVMLSMCAVPRANHTIRILPPSLSRTYAADHDKALWQSFCQLLGAQTLAEDVLAQRVASLPGRLGGLGLRSALRSSSAAYWASWVDVLPVIRAKAQDIAAAMVAALATEEAGVRPGHASLDGKAPCLREAASCLSQVTEAGAENLPTWREAANGAKAPPAADGVDVADLGRGWQCHTSSFLETNFLERMVLPSSDLSRQALLLSQSGGPASAWLRAIPSELAFTLAPLRCQVALRRRLRWPLPLSGGRCCRGCQRDLDSLGDRAAACPSSGRLKLRSRPLEKVWTRALRESGARVRENVFLRDTALAVIDPADARRIEIVATGLPVARGVPLAVDCTLVSPLRADGSPFPRAERVAGVSFGRAEQSKKNTYPELVDSPVVQLLTVASETGGRMSSAAGKLLAAAAYARARGEPPVLRKAAVRAWRTRWITMISVCIQDALAATLVNDGAGILDGADGPAPLGVHVWLDGGCEGGHAGSDPCGQAEECTQRDAGEEPGMP